MARTQRAIGVAAGLLLVALPLAWTPWTIDLGPQKALVVALALAVAAAARPTAILATLGPALAVAALRPAGAVETFSIASFVAMVAVLSPRDEHEATARSTALAVAVLSIGGIALAQKAGFDPLASSSRPFALPYRVITATLGNPNHVAGLAALALPLLVGLPARSRTLALAAATTAGVTVVLTRSHLGVVVLGAQAAVVAAAAVRRRAGRTAAVAVVASLLGAGGVALASSAGAMRALAGRAYLAGVYLSGLDIGTALMGTGPGREPGRFLAWQARYLADHPDELRFWSFPEFAHDDFVQLAVTWGLVVCLLAVALIVRARPAWRNEILDRRAAIAALASVGLVAAGGSILWSAPVAAIAALAVASSLRLQRLPSAPARGRGLVRAVAVVVGCAWLAITGAHLWSATERRAAVAEMTEGAQRVDVALAHVRRAERLPFDRGVLEHLEGRLLLDAGKPRAAVPVLRRAVRDFGHPEVHQTHYEALVAAGREAEARRALAAWRRARPDDPALPSR